MSIFQPASKAKLPVKFALFGPSGSGKTWSSLVVARGIAGPKGRIALVDTERGSSREYADKFKFDYAEMVTFHPDHFARAIKEATKEGYDVLILDGISPAWNGPGGVQEIVDKNTKGNNSWSGWAAGTPAYQTLVEAILSCEIHLICTMRAKTAWIIGEGNKPVQVGLEPVMRSGIEYEFAFVGMLDLDHQCLITKSRRPEVPVGEVIGVLDEGFGQRLRVSEEATTPQEPQEPAPVQAEVTPEPPAPEPVAEVTAPSESLLDVPTPEPAPTPEAPKSEDGLTLEQIEHLDKLATELKELRPDLDWLKKIDDAAERDYGKKAIELSPENGKALIEKLTNTRNQVRDQQQAGAPA